MAAQFTILHVENDSDDRLFFERAIQRVAPHVLVASVGDGEEAKEYLSRVGSFRDRERYPDPNLIVLDRKMPRCSGAEFLSWLRTRPDFEQQQVAMLSSSDLEDDVIASFAFGANAYFVKPMEWPNWLELAEKIRSRWFGSMQTASA